MIVCNADPFVAHWRPTVIEERRRAARIVLPEVVHATVSGVPVRVLDLSTLGARLQHERRFPLDAPELRLEWREAAVTLAIRAVRSELIADGESRAYCTGIEFAAQHPAVDRVIASIASWAELELSRGSSAAAESGAPGGEDTWTRRVSDEARPSLSRGR
jgi:hypothetical protein